MSNGHLCKAEAPTEAAAETVDFCVSKNTEGEKELKIPKGFTFSLLQSPYGDSFLVRGSLKLLNALTLRHQVLRKITQSLKKCLTNAQVCIIITVLQSKDSR